MKEKIKIIRIGTVKVGKSNYQSVFCSINFDGKRLSIYYPPHNQKLYHLLKHRHPTNNPNMGLSSSDITNWAPGWNKDKLDRFLEIWDKWHLNDMRAGCEHQRVENWGDKDLTLVSIDVETWKIHLALNNEVFTPNGVMEESWFASKGPIKTKIEKKKSNWVYPTEHPEGVLSKACPVCGYHYGTSWLLEEVPQEVIEWLFNLPESDIVPAWI